MERFDKYWIGIVAGLILPAVFVLVYLDVMNLWVCLEQFGVTTMGAVWSKLLLVSVFPNLALIFVFYTTNTWRLSKGVLIGAFPYILAALWISM